MPAPTGHVSRSSRLRSRGLFLPAVLLLALAPGLGSCTEERKPPLEEKPAAAAGVETGDVSGRTDDVPARDSAKDADATGSDNATPGTEGESSGDLADAPASTFAPEAAGNSGKDPEDDSGERSEAASEVTLEETFEEISPQKADNELTQEERLEVAKTLWPPVKSLVTAPFGERRGSILPLSGDAPMKARFHGGLDLRGHLGWPVKSLGDGTVVSAGPGGNAGLMVRIRQADGKSVSYAHLGKVLVKGGDRVTRGQHIGEVGCTGRTTGAHLHINVRDGKGNLLDPEKELEGLWEIYDPPLADLREPINAQSCGRGPGGANPRLRGQQQYLRMRKALLENEYQVPDALPSWEDRDK